MSVFNYSLIDTLANRSLSMKAGTKKANKTALSRAQRHKAQRELLQEVSSLLAAPRLDGLYLRSVEALDIYADWLLSEHPADDNRSSAEEETDLVMDLNDDGCRELPMHLVGSLPDWMLDRLEQANGDAFDALSLFEARSASPKAAISMEDEAMYA